jgi:hypothetical protein
MASRIEPAQIWPPQRFHANMEDVRGQSKIIVLFFWLNEIITFEFDAILKSMKQKVNDRVKNHHWN